MTKPSRKSKKRLAKGMFMRGKVYYVRFRQDGRDNARSLGSDYATAMLRYAEYRANGLTSPTPRLTVAEVAERWLAERIANGRNAKGQELARARVERYLKPFMGSKLLEKVTRSDLSAYRCWLEQQHRTGAVQKISGTTVAWVLGDARCFFRWCVGEGLLAAAPIPDRLLPRLQERPPDRLSDEEVEKLLALPDPWRYAIRFLLETGLRWSEGTRAQAEHVEWGAGMPVLVVSQTKTGKVRRVPVPADLVRGHVGRLLPFACPTKFARAVRRLSGVVEFHPHRLRHTFGCRWIERGGDPLALQDVMGHASFATTQRYARLSHAHVLAEATRLTQVG